MYSEEFLTKFWSRVEKTDTCWLWTAGTRKSGHGQISVNGRTMGAHRVSLEIHLGRPIREGLVVAHTPLICHEPRCVNPVHLREATCLENMLDRAKDGTHVEMHTLRKKIVTEEQADAIRKDPRTSRIIAKDYGISHMSVIAIKKNVIYAAPS